MLLKKLLFELVMLRYGQLQQSTFKLVFLYFNRRERKASFYSRAKVLHTFEGYVRVSCGAIHVKNYVLKVSTIGEDVLEPVTIADALKVHYKGVNS
jgi:hypothetical protein